MKRYEQFQHTADIGVRVFGNSLEELFENAAFAMFDIIADLEGLDSPLTKDFNLESPNHEELLVVWLDELLYNFYTKEIIFSKFKVDELTKTTLKARAFGRPIAENRNRLKTEIKAATYHDLKVRKSDKGYEVEIIFDI